MNAKAESQGSTADTVKLVIALAIMVAGAVAFHIYEDITLWMRVLAMLVVVGIAIAIALQTEKGRSTAGFMREARTEVRKVVWPTRTETIQTTIIVLIMVLLVGVILWLMDTMLFWLIGMLTGRGS